MPLYEKGATNMWQNLRGFNDKTPWVEVEKMMKEHPEAFKSYTPAIFPHDNLRIKQNDKQIDKKPYYGKGLVPFTNEQYKTIARRK
jgi:hypothetical protein